MYFGIIHQTSTQCASRYVCILVSIIGGITIFGCIISSIPARKEVILLYKILRI